MKRNILTLILICVIGTAAFAQNIIEPELQEFMNQNKDEKISVNIIFKSQLDVNELRTNSNNYLDKETKRQAVIKEFKDFSEASQQEVVSFIKSQESKGAVTDMVCHWLSNSITCTTTKNVIEALSKRDDILLIGLNAERKVILEDNKSTSQRDDKMEITSNVLQVNADKVWDLGYTGEGVLVAILDSGVDYEQVDLADHLWDGGAEFPKHGYNFADNNNDPMDGTGHGTHCSGIICGDGSSGTRTGVAPEATLMCVKIINSTGNTDAGKIVSGMEFAVEHGADVLSMSVGIASSSTSEREMLREACVKTLEAGVIAAVAAGNDANSLNKNPIPNNVRVPGSCPAPWIHPDQQENSGATSCVVSVGAVDKNDKPAAFSSQGPVTWQETSYADYPYDPGIGLIRPDVCAPGVDIISLGNNSEDYAKMSGTSQATPCVAGIMSLMLSKNPELTPEQISMILETTAVKLEEKKNNKTGSGRVDALAAINAIDMGDIIFKELTFTDKNNNNKINVGEEIELDITFENISDDSFDNVKAVLKCTNDLVNITNGNVEINNIAANQIFNINEFSFIADNDIKDQTTLFFDIEFYKDDNVISTTRFSVVTFDKDLLFSEVIVRNDDNNNGIIEAGETADLGVVINNRGREIALNVNGILTSNDNNITINKSEAEFGSIAPNSSVTAFYNVTLSNNASDNSDITFNLEIKDKYNFTKAFNINYINTCDIIYNLKDSFGDGWGGAKIIANYNDGSESDSYTITKGKSETFTKTLNTGVEVSLEWKKSYADAECKYSINYDNGVEIFSGSGSQSGTFFSWTQNCSTQDMIIETCEGVKNFNVNIGSNSVNLSWEAPEKEGVINYEIYRETTLIDTTEELSYVDNNLISGSYTYSVRPVYESCNGNTSSEDIAICVGVAENIIPDVTIYPNPSKGIFTIKHDNIESITLYNVVGAKIFEANIDDREYVISDLESGIYFVNIKTNEGSVVKKIVKY